MADISVSKLVYSPITLMSKTQMTHPSEIDIASYIPMLETTWRTIPGSKVSRKIGPRRLFIIREMQYMYRYSGRCKTWRALRKAEMITGLGEVRRWDMRVGLGLGGIVG